MKPTLERRLECAARDGLPTAHFGTLCPELVFQSNGRWNPPHQNTLAFRFLVASRFILPSDRDYIDRNRSPRDDCSEQVEIILDRGSYIVAYT